MPAKRFRVAFSYTGEKRPFVSQVADHLAKRFSEAAILYDKFHKAEFARRDLGTSYLPDLYHDQSDLIVVVLCPDYDKKPWTGLEWTAIHDLLSKRKDETVMLCRFGLAEVKGLYSTAGFLDLDEMTPEQAATHVLERLALNEGRPKDHYTKPAAPNLPPLKTSIPNNLPRLQPFFGREQELAAIREALDPESRTWGTLIDGPGGMGKTSLAVRAAYDCSPDQFRRIIFLSVKDREMEDDGQRRLTGFILPGFIEMLNELARELGQPDIAKAPEDQRIRLLLDALRPAQALLVLDNLESLPKDDRDRLFTFVRRLPHGCKAILTSRRRLGSGSELLILKELDETAALDTLADLARHNPLLAKTSEAERLTLHKQTAGNPLLLRWVAGQLGRGSCRTFTDALHFLRSCPPDNDPLEFVFGDLAQEFTPEETRVLAALSYFTLATSVEHIAAVAGLEEETVESASRSLANRSLVVPDQEETAFTLVPMVADFVRRKRPDVVLETGSRLEYRAQALILENGFKNHERFPLLNAVWHTVAPALPRLIAGPNTSLQLLCAGLDAFLNFTGRWDEQLSLSTQAEAKAVKASDYESAGRRAYDAGWVHYQRKQADAVLTCAERAADHWNRSNVDPVQRSQAIRLRGVAYELKEDYRSAITAYREALDARRRSQPESPDVAIALSDIADAERLAGDSGAAERAYGEALQVARSVGYIEGIATFTASLSALALRREDWSAAEALIRESLPLAEQLGRQDLIATNCHNLATVLIQRRQLDEARPLAQRAADIFSALGLENADAALSLVRMCES